MSEGRQVQYGHFLAALLSALAILAIIPLSGGKTMANYSAGQIFTTTRDEAPGYSRQRIDFSDPHFTFTTLVPEAMTVWTGNGTGGSDDPVALIYEPEERDRFIIEVRRIEFPAFAEAQVAGYGFLGKLGYNRILQDKENSNAAFGHLAGAVAEGNGNYSRMARLATVTRGNAVLFIYAAFDYADYPEFEDVLARFMGAIEMEEPGTPMEALREFRAAGGERVLVPADWALHEEEVSDAGRTDFDLSLGDQEYPNLTATIRPISLEEGRKLGVGMIEQFTKQVEENPKVAFAGEAEMQIYKSESGEPTGYSYARGWDADTGAHLVSEFMIQENADADSISIVGLNSFDVRRSIETFDDEAKDIIFKSWVTGVSANAVLRISLGLGNEYLKNELDIRTLGH